MSHIMILPLSLILVSAGILVSSQQNCAFEVNPKDTSVKRNDNVELQCQPFSNLDFSIWEIFLENGTYWSVTGSDPERQRDRSFEFVPDTGALKILKVEDYHAGVYRCRAIKIFGGRCVYYSDNATLTVQDDNSTPAPVQNCEFEVSPNDTTVNINDTNIELNCRTSGSGNTDFSIWEIFLENGTFWTVTGSDPERQRDRGLEFVPSTGALRFLRVQEFHAGNYRCKATRIVGGRCIYYSDNATVTVREPLPPKPVDVQSFCSHVVWRNPPNTSCDDVIGYDVRLANPDTDEEVIQYVDSSATFYSLHQIDDAFLKKKTTIVQVRVVKNQLHGEFSSPISLGCSGRLSIPEEINRVYSTETGHRTADIPTGVYRCEIPNSSGTTQKLYISLITSDDS